VTNGTFLTFLAEIGGAGQPILEVFAEALSNFLAEGGNESVKDLTEALISEYEQQQK
jgi:hypothetical protein